VSIVSSFITQNFCVNIVYYMGRRGRPRKLNPDLPCPFCNSDHVVKDGKFRGRERYLCGSCNRHFLIDAKHPYPKEKVEEALRMYSNGMSMRGIARVLGVPLSAVFKWVRRHGKKEYEKLVELWGRARDTVEGKTTAKVVDEMWTYIFRNSRAFYKWVFTCFVYSALGLYLVFSVGDRDERASTRLSAMYHVTVGG